MEKAKKFKEVELTFTKVDFAAGSDWNSQETDGLPMGMYLGETPGGGLCIFMVGEFGGKIGMWLPIEGIIKYNTDKQKADFATTLLEVEQRLKKIESLAYDNNLHLNDAEVKAQENATILTRVLESIDLNLANIIDGVKFLQNSKGNQSPSMSELSDAVVNIIKAAK